MINTTQTDAPSKRAKWLPLIIILIPYVLVGINLYRMQPVLSSVMQYMNINEGNAGLLMSICSFVALALTIPMGYVVIQIGCKKAIAAAMVFQIAGALIGYLFTSFAGILFSQLLLGLTNTLVLVTGPTYLQLIYRDKEYSTGVGLLTAAQNTGMCVAFLAIPQIVLNFKLPTIWLVSLYPAVLFIIAWLLMIRGDQKLPTQKAAAESKIPANETGKIKGDTEENGKHPLKDKNMWLLTIGVFFIMLSAGAVLNFASAYLTTYRGMNETVSASVVLTCCIVGVFVAAGAGWLSNVWGKRGVFVFIVFFLTLLRILPVIVPDGILLIIVIALQGVPAASIVVANASIPDISKPMHYRPLAVSMIAMANTGGLALSSVVFGFLVTLLGYHGAFLVLAPLSLLSYLGALPMKAKSRA